MDFVLKNGNSFNGVIMYEVTNSIPSTFEIIDSKILGITYEISRDNVPAVVSCLMSSRERATLVVEHLKVKENQYLSASQKGRWENFF